jgi:hypothetical protein
MTTSIGGTTGITFNDASVQATAATGFGFKNRLINSAMVIDQRNAGASVTNVSSPSTFSYCVDRWGYWATQASKFTMQQSSIAPTGFTTSLKITSSSAYTVLSTDYFTIGQCIEGFNVADLGYGAAGAATVTVSFWVHSSLTGTFGGAFSNASTNRSYAFSYTISAADTWEQKTITVAGDTTGTWNKTNSTGLILTLGLGVGSTATGATGSWAASWYASANSAVNVVSTNGATFYITGVQLEKGSTATSFDYRPYGTELMLCQRYYNKTTTAIGVEGVALNGVSIAYCQQYVFPSTMRLAPTCTSNGFNDGGNMNGNTITDISPESVGLRGTTFSGVAVPTKATGYWNSGIQFLAEL